MEDNRYAPPKAALEGVAMATEPAPALWNPNAAASWCLLFTPIFGAWLHKKNWEALGKPEQARSGRNWLIAGVVVFIATLVIALVMPRGTGGVSRLVSFAFLIAWYYAAAKPQVAYIKGRFGDSYPRKGWLVPIASAVGVIVAFTVVMVALVAMLGT